MGKIRIQDMDLKIKILFLTQHIMRKILVNRSISMRIILTVQIYMHTSSTKVKVSLTQSPHRT